MGEDREQLGYPESRNNCLLEELPVGSRIVVRCRKDWRTATVSAHREDRTVLIISSPTGRSHRKSWPLETEIDVSGHLPVLGDGDWRETFVKYDCRW